MRTALGFRVHSGWAAMVSAAGTLDAPRVLERRRIVIADPDLPGSKQPYHAAVSLPMPEAEEFVRKSLASSRGLALEAISSTVRALAEQGRDVIACGVLMGSGGALPGFDRIISSHPLLHAAEGEMFRAAVVWAAEECRLAVAKMREKGLDPASLLRIESLGKLLGPPWKQDEKYATLAALLALAGN